MISDSWQSILIERIREEIIQIKIDLVFMPQDMRFLKSKLSSKELLLESLIETYQ